MSGPSNSPNSSHSASASSPRKNAGTCTKSAFSAWRPHPTHTLTPHCTPQADLRPHLPPPPSPQCVCGCVCAVCREDPSSSSDGDADCTLAPIFTQQGSNDLAGAVSNAVPFPGVLPAQDDGLAASTSGKELLLPRAEYVQAVLPWLYIAPGRPGERRTSGRGGGQAGSAAQWDWLSAARGGSLSAGLPPKLGLGLGGRFIGPGTNPVDN
jgi:hypothetical protein